MQIKCQHKDGWLGIQKAITQAEAGDTVVIEAGHYIGKEALSITSSLTLQGNKGVTLECCNDGGIHISGKQILIRGLIINAAPFGQCSSLIQIKSGNDITVEDCQLNGRQLANIGIDIEMSDLVTILNNSICNNAQDGVLIIRAKASVLNNLIVRNRRGISSRASLSQPEKTNDIILSNNLCYKNSHTGIAINFGIAHIIGNTCKGGSNGIIVNTYPKNPAVPPTVILEHNKCYENLRGSGIIITDSNAILKNNSCYMNAWGGLVVRTTSKSPNQHYNIKVESNTSFRNGSHGVHILDCNASITENNCWGNKGYGMLMQSIFNSNIERNQCHHNAGSGIHIDECSRTVQLSNNSCFQNETGISVFSLTPSSSGSVTLKHNICEENNNNSIEYNGLNPNGNRPEPHSKKRQEKLASHPLSQWLSYSLKDSPTHSPDQLLALADFVSSNGCNGCFNTFWDESKPETAGFVADRESQISEEHRTQRLYKINIRDKSGFYIANLPKHQVLPTPDVKQVPAENLKLMHKVIAHFFEAFDDSLFENVCSYPTIWVCALVTCNDSDVSDFSTTLNKFIEQHNSDGLHLSLNTFDMEDLVSKRKPGVSFIEAALLKNKPKWLTRLRLVGAAFLSPTSPITWLGSAFLFTSAFLGISIAGLLGWLEKLDVPFINLLKSFSQGVTPLGITILFLMLLPAYFNRRLPKTLHISRLFIDFLVSYLSGIDPHALPKNKLVRRLYTFLFADQPSAVWLQKALHDKKWFFSKRSNAAIILIKNMDQLSQADITDLRNLIALRHKNQAIFVINHMNGISMLPHTFLDTWYDPKSKHKLPITNSYIIHDISSQELEFNVGEITLAETKQLLSKTLAWPAVSANSIDIDAHLNSLTDDKWSLDDMLPSIVLGTTPFIYMSFTIYNSSNPARVKDELIKELSMYHKVETSTEQTSHFVEAFSERQHAHFFSSENASTDMPTIAAGWFPRKIETSIQFLGRAGLRKKLGGLLINIFPNNKVAGLAYLDDLLSCGEIFHLSKFHELFGGMNKDDGQFSILHLEAAIFLHQDRVELREQSSGISPMDFKAWLGVLNLMNESQNEELLLKFNISRLAGVILKILSGKAFQKSTDAAFLSLQQKMLDLLTAGITDTLSLNIGEKSIWFSFIFQLQATLNALSNANPEVSQLLLKNEIACQWPAMTNELKGLMLKKLSDSSAFPAQLLQNLCRAGSYDDFEKIISKNRYYPQLVVPYLALIVMSSNHSKSQIADAVLEIKSSLLSHGLLLGPPASLDLLPVANAETIEYAKLMLLNTGSRGKLISILCNVIKTKDLKQEAVIEGITVGNSNMMFEELRLLGN